MDEVAVWSRDGVRPTAWGREWLDFCRYAGRHPKRGEQQCKIGFLRAYGDEWNRVGGPVSMQESSPHLPIKEMWQAWGESPRPFKWYRAAGKMPMDWDELVKYTYLWDYELLNVVFASYGSAYRTEIDRLATGTPYGPVDFIPWDIGQERLDEYSVVVHLGRGVGVDAGMIERLERFAGDGGTVILAAGQLRDDEGELAVSSFCGIGLGETKLLDNENPYTVLSGGAVLERLSTGDALAVEKAYGRGKVIMFSGEWVCDKGAEFAKGVLRGELEGHKWVEFVPGSDWLEYFVSKRDGVWIVTVFNHGRGCYPSGNGVDYGAWSGEIDIDTGKLGLEGGGVEVFGVCYDDGSKLPFSLEKLPVSVEGSTLRVSLAVGEFEEIVIGPAGETEARFFCRQSGDINRDCGVDVLDLELLGRQWLEPGGCAGFADNCADLGGDDGVNLADFVKLAENWLE